jgi:hypothetical protein
MICEVKLAKSEENLAQRKGKILTYVYNVLIQVWIYKCDIDYWKLDAPVGQSTKNINK